MGLIWAIRTHSGTHLTHIRPKLCLFITFMGVLDPGTHPNGSGAKFCSGMMPSDIKKVNFEAKSVQKLASGTRYQIRYQVSGIRFASDTSHSNAFQNASDIWVSERMFATIKPLGPLGPPSPVDWLRALPPAVFRGQKIGFLRFVGQKTSTKKLRLRGRDPSRKIRTEILVKFRVGDASRSFMATHLVAKRWFLGTLGVPGLASTPLACPGQSSQFFRGGPRPAPPKNYDARGRPPPKK